MVPICKLFNISYGNQFDFSKMAVTDKGINFISRGSTNNGFVAKVALYNDIEPFPPGLITVTMGGSYLLASFVQTSSFYTAQNIKVLNPKFDMDLRTKLFYCAAIQHNRFRYHSHSREANSTFDDILVPDLNEIPSWISKYRIEEVKDNSIIHRPIDLNKGTWKWFKLGDKRLFIIKKGKRLTKADMIDGDIRYIGAIEGNNGVSGYIANDKYLHPANTITVSYNGSVAEAYYQDKKYWATDDVNVLYPQFELNQYIALFITTIIRKEKYRFNYGRKWDKELMEESQIKLPVDLQGNPDWKFMEDYIKSLPYSMSLDNCIHSVSDISRRTGYV